MASVSASCSRVPARGTAAEPGPAPIVEAVEGLWIQISRIEHHAYCPRQAVLIDREAWTDSRETVRGSIAHASVDSSAKDHRHGLKIHHAVALRHDRLLIRGTADTIEEHPDGRLVPVEHKSGRATADTTPAVLQVVAQALCLESMTGRAVPSAAVFFMATNSRLDVDVRAHQSALESAIAELRLNLKSPRLPPWTSQVQRCHKCSIRLGCMPELAGRESA
ncbi:unannotated protein [freshwater metagenome]|uniref:5' to 3' exodeoxyribonuclease (nucleoside 3'-phosphate-forming) n=1 Tax=freshwater metagenome TaxID=449393 RepID=A0A6J7L521_9ZZZZ